MRLQEKLITLGSERVRRKYMVFGLHLGYQAIRKKPPLASKVTSLVAKDDFTVALATLAQCVVDSHGSACGMRMRRGQV